MEAEKHGDFTLAEFARRGEARFYRVVAIPFHEKSAREFERSGQLDLAVPHRRTVGDSPLIGHAYSPGYIKAMMEFLNVLE